jgi:DNA-directed RNA polymerase specialized sigma24 family protein
VSNLLLHDHRDLIAGVIKGDHSSQEVLYSSFASKMFAICLQVVNDRHHAEDVVQEGFLKVFVGLKSFRFRDLLTGGFARFF